MPGNERPSPETGKHGLTDVGQIPGDKCNEEDFPDNNSVFADLKGLYFNAADYDVAKTELSITYSDGCILTWTYDPRK